MRVHSTSFSPRRCPNYPIHRHYHSCRKTTCTDCVKRLTEKPYIDFSLNVCHLPYVILKLRTQQTNGLQGNHFPTIMVGFHTITPNAGGFPYPLASGAFHLEARGPSPTLTFSSFFIFYQYFNIRPLQSHATLDRPLGSRNHAASPLRVLRSCPALIASASPGSPKLIEGFLLSRDLTFLAISRFSR